MSYFYIYIYIYIYILSYNSVKNYKQENIKLTERNQVDSLK